MEFPTQIQDAITSILLAVITTIVVWLSAEIRGWLVMQKQRIQQRTNSYYWQILNEVVSVVVKAVEQDAIKGRLVNEAEKKKAEAIKRVQQILNEKGLGFISVETISTAIEAALREGLHLKPSVIASTATINISETS